MVHYLSFKKWVNYFFRAVFTPLGGMEESPWLMKVFVLELGLLGWENTKKILKDIEKVMLACSKK